MPVTTFQGTVENGRVRLAADVRLPENATVYVVVPDMEPNVSDEDRSQSGQEQSPQARGQRMAAALERLAAIPAFPDISDPVAWQRAERADRDLPDRAP